MAAEVVDIKEYPLYEVKKEEKKDDSHYETNEGNEEEAVVSIWCGHPILTRLICANSLKIK